MHKYTKYILLMVSLIAMMVGFFVFAQRSDGELIQTADTKGWITLTLDPDSTASLFICLPDERAAELPQSIPLPGTDESIELTGPRPLSLPTEFAKKYSIASHVQCSVTDRYEVTEVAEILQFQAPENALVVTAISRKGLTILENGLFFSFLLALWFGIALFSVQKQSFHIEFRRYDSGIAFILALLLALGIAEATTQFIPTADTLFPSYAELISLFGINFLSFLIAVAGVGAVRHFLNQKNQHSISTDSCNENNEAQPVPQFKPWISLALGFALASTAAILVSFAPLPGLTTIEMASQLRSTCLISAIFAVLAGVSEELLFRGCIQSSLEARPDSRHPLAENIIAISVATFLFVLLHVPQSEEHLWALIPIASVSIISGCMKIHYRSIFPSILLHMTYNTTLLLPSVLL